MFFETVARHGSREALRSYAGKEAGWQSITYNQLALRVQGFAAGLATQGVGKGDRVAILSENCPQWVIADLAAQSLGATVVPIYPTLPASQVTYILQNSGAKVAVVQDAKQRAKITEPIPVIVIEPEKTEGAFLPFTEVEEYTPLPDFTDRWKAITDTDVASFVYTSGTTGDPKGAMLTHLNFTSNVNMALTHLQSEGTRLSEEDTFLSFLPLSHIYERTAGYYLALRLGATIAYSRGARYLTDDYEAVQPTIMFCVPRLYEMIQERMLETIAKMPEKKRTLVEQALAFGREAVEIRMAGKSLGFLRELKWAFYDQLVYKKLRARFGGRLRFVVAGGAALNPETGKFFLSFDLPICEGYGMTESSPIIAVNIPGHIRLGTVGRPIKGVEVKIAPDGEICARGDLVMKGYWQNETATKEMIDDEGWLHTGDIGVLDEDGYLKITDRKKDIIVLGNGKNVAPQPIESALKKSPLLAEVVLIGDKQSIITALVVPELKRLEEWAKAENLPFANNDALIALPQVKDKIRKEINNHSVHLADFEKVKKFTLLNTTFSIESGELTPTLKIKRKVILQKWAKEVAEMRGDE
jgi:long-chain acyl-CoA synthetase